MPALSLVVKTRRTQSTLQASTLLLPHTWLVRGGHQATDVPATPDVVVVTGMGARMACRGAGPANQPASLPLTKQGLWKSQLRSQWKGIQLAGVPRRPVSPAAQPSSQYFTASLGDRGGASGAAAEIEIVIDCHDANHRVVPFGNRRGDSRPG
jgi:hypothetical protein